MEWQKLLGKEIKEKRELRGYTQQQLAEKTKITRAQISNIEKGKCAAAVNKITQIAEALDTHFVVLGCRIERDPQGSAHHPIGIVPQQLSLEFDLEYLFEATTLKLTRTGTRDIEMRAVFSNRRTA
jgi:transcriptional regulator with XRE-family HTH domain